jgi:hypothetical protein
MTTKSTLGELPGVLRVSRTSLLRFTAVRAAGRSSCRIEAVAQCFGEKSLSGIIFRCENLIPMALPRGSLGLLPNDRRSSSRGSAHVCRSIRPRQRLGRSYQSRRNWHENSAYERQTALMQYKRRLFSWSPGRVHLLGSSGLALVPRNALAAPHLPPPPDPREWQDASRLIRTNPARSLVLDYFLFADDTPGIVGSAEHRWTAKSGPHMYELPIRTRPPACGRFPGCRIAGRVILRGRS